MVIAGIILIVVGLIALLAGVGGGIAAMIKAWQTKPSPQGLSELPTEFIKALTEFAKALTAAPVWLAMNIIGILLVAWGGSML